MDNYEEILRDLKSGIYDLSRLSRENMNTEEIAEYEGDIASLDKIVVDLEVILPRAFNAYSKFRTEQQLEVFNEELKPDVIETTYVDDIKEPVKEEVDSVVENIPEKTVEEVVEPVKAEVVPVVENIPEKIVQEVVEPVKAEVVPVVENVPEKTAEEAVEPVKAEVAPVVENIPEKIAEEVVEPVKAEVAPVVENVPEKTAEEVVEPVKAEVAPVVENVPEKTAEEVVEPVNAEVAPVVDTRVFIRQTNANVRAILVNKNQMNNLESSLAVQKTIFDDVMNPKDVVVVDKNKSIEELKKEQELLLQQAQNFYNSGNKEEAAKLYDKIAEISKNIKERETEENKVLAYTN